MKTFLHCIERDAVMDRMEQLEDKLFSVPPLHQIFMFYCVHSVLRKIIPHH